MTIDNDFMLRATAAGALNASETTAVVGIDFGGPDLKDRCYMVYCPSAPTGTSPTLDVKIQESADNTTFVDFLAFPQITAAGEYYVTGRSNQRYRRYQATLGGSGTPAFATVLIAVVPGGRDKNW